MLATKTNSMTKTDLIDAVSLKAGLTKKDSAKAVDAVVASIIDALCDNDKVTIPGFGSFLVKTRSARTGRNPKTGETIEIGESLSPAFKSSNVLKATVNNKK